MTNADLDYIKNELAAVTVKPKDWFTKYGTDATKWPASHMKNAVGRLDSLRTATFRVTLTGTPTVGMTMKATVA